MGNGALNPLIHDPGRLRAAAQPRPPGTNGPRSTAYAALRSED